MAAEIIEFALPEKAPSSRSYNVDIMQHQDGIAFTVNGVRVNPGSLRQIADELEKIAQIIRTDVVTGLI